MQVYNDAVFNTKFNQVKHTVELYLDSSDGDSDSDDYKFPINPNSIVNLTIEDTLSDWVVKGHMTFFYNPESGSSEIDKFLGQQNSKDSYTALPKPKPFYSFRNDGFDRLRIRIKPDLQDSNIKLEKLSISDPVHWSLSYIFNIYDIEDIGSPPGAQNASSATIKCLKVYFWDEWYQYMLSNIIEYSTASSNTDQKKETGLAMKEIIEKTLTKPSGIPLDTTDGVPVGEWENGLSKIFFTAPAQSSAYESLMYIYDKHMSEKQSGEGACDFSLMIKERGPDENSVGQLTLRPTSSFFDKAGSGESSPGEYQTEHFYVQSYSKEKSTTSSLRGPKSDGGSDVVDFSSLKYSAITSYRFVDISPLMNATEFTTHPVHSFDFKNRLYNIEFKQNSVETARKFIANEYIQKMYKNNKGDLERLFLISLNENKKSDIGRNLKPVFSLYGEDEDLTLRQYAGLQKLLYTGVFQNACIHFRTLGLTNREPGRFIAIDKTEGVDSGEFQDKFYGQWFVINVKHVFETEIYYNEITAIKIYRFDESPIKFPATF